MLIEQAPSRSQQYTTSRATEKLAVILSSIAAADIPILDDISAITGLLFPGWASLKAFLGDAEVWTAEAKYSEYTEEGTLRLSVGSEQDFIEQRAGVEARA